MSRRHWSKTLHEDPSDGCMRCTGHIDPSAFIAELHARCGEVKSEDPGCERHCNASMVRHVYHKHLPTGPAELCSVILIPCEPGEQGSGMRPGKSTLERAMDALGDCTREQLYQAIVYG